MPARRILLGLSFFNQTAEVTDTLQTFLDVLGNRPYEVVLGLENEKSRNQVTPVLDSLQSQGWPICYLWDNDVNQSAMQLLDRTRAMPFFQNFSYGAAVNRMLLLAIASGCEYLVRVDPGTGCPLNIAQLVDHHTAAISQGKKVVSGQYTKRPAIRDDFVQETEIERFKYYGLIEKYTGIDCWPAGAKATDGRIHRGQITGGAAMTMSPEGPPAIVFDKVRVWASDDGFFQMYFGADQTEVQNQIKIERSEPGFGLQLSAYAARVAAMVLLRNAHEGKGRDLALQETRKFLQDLNPLVSGKYSYDPTEAEGLLTPEEVGAVYSGYENYLKLVEEWPVTAHRLIDAMPPSPLRLW